MLVFTGLLKVNEMGKQQTRPTDRPTNRPTKSMSLPLPVACGMNHPSLEGGKGEGQMGCAHEHKQDIDVSCVVDASCCLLSPHLSLVTCLSRSFSPLSFVTRVI